MRWIDGVASDDLPADDRGLQFGDGLFETVAVVDRAPRLLDAHLDRLDHGARSLGLPPPDRQTLRDEARTLSAQGAACGVLKIIWSAGSGGRGYARPDTPSPRRILSFHPAPANPADHWHSGVIVALCQLRLARQPALARLKHLNRLEQVLARAEWAGSDAAEGLMLDQDGRVIEGTMSNLFAVDGGTVVTPVLDGAGVAGVMRGAIMERLTQQGMAVRERELTVDALSQCEEVFVCNSINGVWPVRELRQARTWPVGPVTRQLQAWIDEQRLACTPVARGEEET